MLLIFGVMAVFGFAAYFYYSAQEPIYRASSMLLVIEGDANLESDISNLQASERLARSYVRRLSNSEVLSQAIDKLDLTLDPDELERNLRVQLVGDTQLIELSIDHPNPQVAMDLANEIPRVFAERNSNQQLERFASYKSSLEKDLKELQDELVSAEKALNREISQENPEPATVARMQDNTTRLHATYSQLLASYDALRLAETGQIDNIIVDEMAQLPMDPIRPHVFRQTFLASVLGCLISIGILFLRRSLDDTIKDPESIQSQFGLNALGFVPQMSVKDPENSLVVTNQPRSIAAEAYRQLRTNLVISLHNQGLKTILVTSTNQGEGKTTIAINLALALAQIGERVILVDSDLRRSRIHVRLDVKNDAGITTLLLNADSSDLPLKKTSFGELSVLTSGPLLPNPADLLSTERMTKINKILREKADYVIYDSPPILAVTDATLLSRMVDTTVLVAIPGKTNHRMLQTAVSQIQTFGGYIIGIILNQFPSKSSYYYQIYTSYDDKSALTGASTIQKGSSAQLSYDKM